MSRTTDEHLFATIMQRIADTGEYTYQSYPSLLNTPGFKSAGLCAQLILELFAAAVNILVERSPGLNPAKAIVLESNRRLLVPSKDGRVIHEYPSECLQNGKFILKHAQSYARPYSGPADLLVVGCYAFTPGEPLLWDIGNEAAAGRIDRMEDGLDNGFQLTDDTIRVAVAADCQEIECDEWPEYKRSQHLWVHAVITPTRIINLHTGETASLEPVAEQGEHQQ